MPGRNRSQAAPRPSQTVTAADVDERLSGAAGIGNRALAQLHAADSHHDVQALAAMRLGAGNQAVQRLTQATSGGSVGSGVIQRKPTSLTTPGLSGSTMGSQVDAGLERVAVSIREAQVRQQREESRRISTAESAAGTADLQRRIYISQQAGPLVERIVTLEVDAQGPNFDRPRLDRDAIRQRWTGAVQASLQSGRSLQDVQATVASINGVLNGSQSARQRLEALGDLF